MKKKHEEWWECPNQRCGAEILFFMLGPSPVRAQPTCFCGSPMRRVVKLRGRRYSILGKRPMEERDVPVLAPVVTRYTR